MYTADKDYAMDGSISNAVDPKSPKAVFPFLKKGDKCADFLAIRYGLMADPAKAATKTVKPQADKAIKPAEDKAIKSPAVETK